MWAKPIRTCKRRWQNRESIKRENMKILSIFFIFLFPILYCTKSTQTLGGNGMFCRTTCRVYQRRQNYSDGKVKHWFHWVSDNSSPLTFSRVLIPPCYQIELLLGLQFDSTGLLLSFVEIRDTARENKSWGTHGRTVNTMCIRLYPWSNSKYELYL